MARKKTKKYFTKKEVEDRERKLIKDFAVEINTLHTEIRRLSA